MGAGGRGRGVGGGGGGGVGRGQGNGSSKASESRAATHASISVRMERGWCWPLLWHWAHVAAGHSYHQHPAVVVLLHLVRVQIGVR